MRQRADGAVEQSKSYKDFVIPAKAGIHLPWYQFNPSVMDLRLRGGDESRFKLRLAPIRTAQFHPTQI